MPDSTAPRPAPLSVERIVDAASRIVERDGLGGLSMRKLGAELQVDPMAVYHHVADKRQLLRLVTARTIGGMAPPDPTAPWDVRVRQWATRYWELVIAHRELTLAGLADPEIARGGLPSTAPLVAAVADSGLASELVEANAFVVVDAVHGAALGVGAHGRHGDDDLDRLRTAFEIGLDTIVAGITARARSSADPGRHGGVGRR
jgi:TetR/AcrR family transcriptional regulator, tetracycline repressor protein